jgi:hypothetical protein
MRSSILNKILLDWRESVKSGVPDTTDATHLSKLFEILGQHGWPGEARMEFIGNIVEQKKKTIDPETPVKYTIKDKDGKDIQKTTTYGQAIKRHTDSSAFKAADALRQKGTGEEPEKPRKGLKPSDFERDFDKEEPKEKPKEKPTVSGVSSESIDYIDGVSKNNVMNGEEKVPGRESSAVAEIGVGYAMGCLADNNNDIVKAERCLEEKLSESSLGTTHGTGDGKKAIEMRKGMLRSAKRENQKVREINEQLGWKNSQTSHIGGSKSSLQATVDALREKGITHVNGIPLDEYEEIIIGGGARENPTDTIGVIVNEETGEAIMYHTSNKMTSADQIANGSPAKEIKEIVSLGEFDDEDQRKQAKEAGETTRKKIAKYRKKQRKYIQQQQDKMIEDAEDDEIARRAVNRLKGEENPVTTASDKAKYWKKILAHQAVKRFMKEKGYDKNNLTPEQELEIYRFYLQEMKRITSMKNPPKNRQSGGVGEADIQIITRLYGEGEEEKITGNPGRDPLYSSDKMKSFYDKQTKEMNTLREKMNNIKPGSGDKAFADRMAKRLHLDQAEGHNPGGIPNDKAETIMGVYRFKDLQQDSEGNMVQQKGGKFYKLDENGKMTDEEVNKEDVQEFDCAVVADKETMAACLGMKEGEKATDDIGITMGEYEGTKAIIYDRNKKPIGVQTARSKSGPGGTMQDSIAYHKDFQRCLAKQTKIQGKCG